MSLSRNLFLTILFCLSAMYSNSQEPVKQYEAEWKKVDEFTQKGLPQSALEQVRKIYALAKKENRDAQVIKALTYMVTVQEQIREDNLVQSINEIETEIKDSREPATSILKSLLAGVYWRFYQNNRWKIYNRSETVNFKKEDIATWSTEDFHKKISELYQQSVANDKLLQQTKPDHFDAILTKGNVRHLRPTLFDLLAYEALEYFKNDERDIKKPAYAFEINTASAFDPAADFVTRKFPTKDSFSLEHKALLTYQQLIDFHLQDADHSALIDADIARLEFVRSNSTHPDKDQLYFNAINHIAHQYENLPAAAQAWYLVAAYYNAQADEYSPHGATSYRFARVKAKEIAEKIIKQKDSSEGKINAWNLLQSINSKSLTFYTEKVNLPGQAFRSLVKYKNISRLYLRIIKPDENLKKLMEKHRSDDIYWNAVTDIKAIKSWTQSLPATKDFQEHSTEIKIDGLPSGEYLLLASDNENFSGKKTALGARYFYVSAISYINNGQDYFVLNRDNGKPLANASVQIWEQKYDYKISGFTKEKARLYTTNANGFFKLETPGKEKTNSGAYYHLLDITHGSDRLFLDETIYNYYYSNTTDKEEPKITNSVFLFTDRSIYRPGQTVYFKGIVINRNNKEKGGTVNTDYTTTIILRNANYKDVDTIRVKTNEYGSFSGKFQLPQSGLNGHFTIYTKNDGGQAGFNVEEYKRPKFYVEYEPVKGTYKVNDNITATGIAKAYAGNAIDGATVKYRVVRQPRFVYPWLFWRWWQPPTREMEITHGETVTDKDGKFSITFSVIPDLSIDKKFEPVFDYMIYTDVTDINGETRSGEKTVSVSYKALMLAASVPSRLPADSLKKISILTQNMNGEFEPANVSVTITKLKEEKRLIRNRFWARPDQFVMRKEEYIKNFPYDEYDNESDYRSWGKGENIFSRIDSSKVSGEWRVGSGKFTPGFYTIEIVAKDKNGEEVKDVKYIELYDEKSKKLNKPQYLWTGINNTTVAPGEIAKVELGTAADDLFIVHQISKGPGLTTHDYQFLKLNNQKQTYSFDVTEQDRGGYGVSWIFVKNNRFYQLNQTINVPWTNKQLNIEYATYRDKTLPGSEEKWKIRISGEKNEKIAAEMLATMYDASLDQFLPHSWSVPYLWPSYYARSYWDGSRNFNDVQSNQRYTGEGDYKNLLKQYDQFLFPKERYLQERMVAYAKAESGEPSPGVADQDMSPAPSKEELDADDVADTISIDKKPDTGSPASGDVKVRKNFNETAFFFPDLKTDSAGAIEFSFTMPEALTRWKFLALAHTKDASFGASSKEIITQKELMVQPNPPRFLREGDKMEFSAKVVNMTDKEITGTAAFQLFDATTNQPVDGWFQNSIPNQYFTVAAGQSEAVKFPIEVPYQYNKALVWRIVAKAGDYSDGEENVLPVLTNRMLVTETLPLNVKGSGTKNFTFEKLLSSSPFGGGREGANTLQHHAITLEYTSNPAWYAVQALPYLMEYPYDCAEQTWNRYYANSLASMIANSSPKIKEIFKKWESEIPPSGGGGALLSNLQKNEELKSILLEETPWVLQAGNESEQKRNIALLFDMVKMSEQLNSSYDKLKQMQSSNGGFVWFAGGPDDRYMTQYIVTGIGHLFKLDAVAKDQEAKLKAILTIAIPYLDKKIKEDYDNLLKNKTDLKKYSPGYTVIQYLYMRSFFPEYAIAKNADTAYNYFRERMQKTWVQQSKYMQAMAALALHRTNDTKTPAAILKSLKESSIVHDELGRYFKNQPRGWFWYEAPIETQALLIEAFSEAGNDTKTVDELKTWLLQNKQTNNWKTTKATAEACYALLVGGSQWLSSEPVIEIKLGNTTIRSTDVKAEAGTGYFKQTIEGKMVKPEMGNIVVTKEPPKAPLKADLPSWGAVYWQYFEDLDKITTSTTPLQLSKKIFIQKNTDKGPVLSPVNDGDIINTGDKITVRIELRADRDMEYVHMKDMRATALEPVNVLSGYKWQGGLGYYESTKDASTNFFFSHLYKGTYVFEYSLFATHAGNFSNGVTTIQCMYAPEFSSHSEGVRITIE